MPRSLLRFLFKLLYHQLAWSYDLVAWLVSAGQWRHWVMSVLPYLNGSRVLELGPGPGHLLHAMYEKGILAVGLDASPQMSRLVCLWLSGLGGNCLCVNGYAQFIGIRASAFDQVVATFPTEYIADPLCLAEVFRVLKPGGDFYILPSAWLTDHRLLFRIAKFFLWYSRISNGYAKDTERHPLLPALEAAGFQVNSWMQPVENHGIRSMVWLIRAQKPNLNDPHTPPIPHF